MVQWFVNSGSVTLLKICYYGRQWDLVWCNATINRQQTDLTDVLREPDEGQSTGRARRDHQHEHQHVHDKAGHAPELHLRLVVVFKLAFRYHSGIKGAGTKKKKKKKKALYMTLLTESTRQSSRILVIK